MDPRSDNAVLPRVFPTVVHMLAEAARVSPQATALVCENTRLDYAQYLRSVAGFARELVGLGARSARVALICGNSIDTAVAMFAAHAAGAQVVPINPTYTARELSAILEDSDPRVVVYDGDSAATVEPIVGKIASAHAIRLGAGRSLIACKDDASQILPVPLPDPTDLATLQYTGGTTGRSKGVNITHAQMAINISQREAALPTRPDDESILCMMPLFHVFAVAMCLHLAVYCRGKLVIMPRYKPEALLDLVEQERITRLPAGPTVFIGLMTHEGFARADFSRLRTAYSGSAPLPEETLKQWERLVGTPILEGFGQTEAGPVLTYVRETGPRIAGSVGQALPLTTIEIVDVESGKAVLPVGQVGEIRARGPQVMSGYRNLPAETAATLRDGWLYTGDIGELDAQGNLYIRDRKKDMVIVGGYNVYPREVDEVLFTHPEVGEAAAVGVPDSYYGETVHAYVALRAGAKANADDLIAHCRTSLARYKVPSRVHLVDALPRTTVGKVDKNALRKLASG
ncbi:MAG: long-chain fatty acid--CoA ligase [Alphaproteobacteria bacterium]|nr:long-chain fatty acid--CoA ligase [Alphaproteobacteria bacterium]